MRHGQHSVLAGRHARAEEAREVEGPLARHVHGLPLGGARGAAVRAQPRRARAPLARADAQRRRARRDVVHDLARADMVNLTLLGMKLTCGTWVNVNTSYHFFFLRATGVKSIKQLFFDSVNKRKI